MESSGTVSSEEVCEQSVCKTGPGVLRRRRKPEVRGIIQLFMAGRYIVSLHYRIITYLQSNNCRSKAKNITFF